MNVVTVEGGAGVRLHAREWGEAANPPILMIHGWSQSHLCWMKQYESELLDRYRIIAVDLRGHGMSEAPQQADQYTEGDRWADDIAAVLGVLDARNAVLVGWSYGGLVIADYLRKYGDGNVAGINLAGAAVALGPDAFGRLIGPAFMENAPGAMADDLLTNITAVRSLLRACVARPLPQDDFEVLLASSMVVRPRVRSWLAQRELDFGPVLKSVKCPVLVSHGRLDRVVLPAMARYVLEQCPTAEISWYDGVGHVPFLEEPERFNGELARFARHAHN